MDNSMEVPAGVDRDGFGDKVSGALYLIRGKRVLLDADIAEFFATTTGRVNQYRSRNAHRFTEDYAFEVTREEWDLLKSQNVISEKLLKRKYLPWAYTEHGFTMLSMGMKGERAALISHVVIDTFVQYRRGTLPTERVLGGRNSKRDQRALLDAIYAQMQSLLELPLPTGNDVGSELQSITTKAINRVKAVIDAPVVNQEKLIKEIALIEADTARTYSEINKMEAETHLIWVKVVQGRLDTLARMREMATQLERDAYTLVAEQTFDSEVVDIDGMRPLGLPSPEDHET
jgi:hypothetical protein